MITEEIITNVPGTVPEPPWYKRKINAIIPAMAPETGPKNKADTLKTTERPSKINPSLKTSGLIIPIIATIPKRSP
jgi:hypothetical protein